MALRVDAVPSHAGYWEGLYQPLTRPQTVLPVLGLLAQRLARAPRGDDEDRFLVRARLTVGGPSPDRVWISAAQEGRPVDLRAWAVERREALERDGLAPHCAGLVPEIVGSFPVDAAEFYARCVPHYDGFLHAWTSDASVRAGYLDWSPERRACFHHEYLLYADNHRSRAAPESGLQQAATWLRPQRRYILQWKLELRARAVPRPEWTRRVEAPLLEAIQALRDRACEASQRWELPLLDALLNGHYPAPPGHGSTAEMLRRLGCDEGRIQRLRLIHAAYELPRGGGEPPHDPVAEDRERVAQLARDALSWCW